MARSIIIIRIIFYLRNFNVISFIESCFSYFNYILRRIATSRRMVC